MAPPKFPTAEEREALKNELLQAAQTDAALKTSQHYQAYCRAVGELNELMDSYSQAEEPYGIPETLDAAGKERLMTAIAETARLGETFLADVLAKKPGADLKKGVPGLATRLQEMLSGDYEMLSAYDPEDAKLSFPELQENARTQIIDFRGQQLPRLGQSQSSRLPMTVVDAAGKRRRGVFTKASHVDVKGKFDGMLQKLGSYYDSREFQQKLPELKRKLFESKAQPAFIKSPEDLLDETVVNEMKDRLSGVLTQYKFYLKEKGKKIYGVEPDDASEEQLIGYLSHHLRKVDEPGKLLEAMGVTPEYLGPKVYEGLRKGLEEYQTGIVSTVDGALLRLKDGDRLDQRNSAMSAVAALLGTPKLVARSENMKYLDEQGNVVEGTFTEFSKGMDLFTRDGGPCLTHVCNEPFGPPSGITKSLADLQVLDYICGNVDRHAGNLTFFTDKNGVFTGVQGIDNDSSFGLCRPGWNGSFLRLNGAKDLQVVSKSMADKVKALTPDMLRFALRGRGLNPKELQAACDRLTDLQRSLERGSVQASSDADLRKAGDRICIVKDEDMKNLSFELLAKNKDSLFYDMKDRYRKRVLVSRESYPFRPNARREAPKKLTEVGTADRKYVAGGIAQSMQAMSRAVENKVTGFKVGDLSKFLRSSGKFRSMVSAVKDARSAAAKINKAIGADKEKLDRSDPQVREQLQKADRAMAKVKTATEAYLQKKMQERHVENPEDLRTHFKNEYELKRINYALKLREEVRAYESIQNPQNDQAKQEKDLTAERVRLARTREAQPAPAPQGPAPERGS